MSTAEAVEFSFYELRVLQACRSLMARDVHPEPKTIAGELRRWSSVGIGPIVRRLVKAGLLEITTRPSQRVGADRRTDDPSPEELREQAQAVRSMQAVLMRTPRTKRVPLSVPSLDMLDRPPLEPHGLRRPTFGTDIKIVKRINKWCRLVAAGKVKIKAPNGSGGDAQAAHRSKAVGHGPRVGVVTRRGHCGRVTAGSSKARARDADLADRLPDLLPAGGG